MSRPIILVFGSNSQGRHGKGAALTAYKKHGARYGCSYGHYGHSFAIPTMNGNFVQLPLERIAQYVQGFLAFAKDHQEFEFHVSRIGCGLAGHKDHAIAPMFQYAPDNCSFDEAWFPFLGSEYFYWGHFD